MHSKKFRCDCASQVGVIALLAVLAILLGGISTPAQTPMAPPYYKVVDLGPLPGGTTSSALAVNDPPHPNGIDADYLSKLTVVGQANIGTKQLPFLWRNGVIEVIGDPATMKSGLARDVNGAGLAGKIVGEWVDLQSKRHAFAFDSNAGFRDLLKPAGHLQASGWGINEANQIVGYTTNSGGAALPVRWDDDSQPPTILYTGALLTYNTQSCTYSGHGFSIVLPIKINQVGHVVTTWSQNISSNCGWPPGYSITSIVANMAVRNINGTWERAFLPTIACYPYWGNPKFYDCSYSQGTDINNNDTVIDYGRYIGNRPGLPMFGLLSYIWKTDFPYTTAAAYTVDAGPVTCREQDLQLKGINDSEVTVGYHIAQDNQSTNCLDGKPYTIYSRGFVKQLGGPRYYLLDRIPPDCGWTTLGPNDINNAGVIVGAGVHSDGGKHAFMLIPTDTMPGPGEGCIGHGETPETNQPPVAEAGPDQVVEATSPAGADVTLNGGGSSDPDGDPLTYTWTTLFGELTGVSPTLTLPLGMHTISLTVEDSGGETSSDAVTVTVQDTTPPETTITAQPAGVSNVASPSFAFEGLDAVTPPELLVFECTLDGAPWAVCSSPQMYTNLADGSHEFQVRATDDTGNTDGTPATFLWTIDATPPSIVIASPAQAASFILGSAQSASYTCSDSGSGIDTCTGTLPDGSTIGTSTVGSYSFTVEATDLAGNHASATHDYTVGYRICGYQPFAARRAGSVIPIKLYVCDSGGLNLSALSTVVTATSVIRVSDSANAPLEDAGNSNPDFNFRFDPTQFDGAGGYIFNLDTNGFGTGTYWLCFRVSGDPGTRRVEFQIR